MASMMCHKTTEKGLNQGYYGGSTFGQKVSDTANWAYEREDKYQRAQNNYAMAYSGSNCYHPKNGINASKTAYEMVELCDNYGRSYGRHQSQNGNGSEMSKTKVHGHRNGFGGHPSNGMAQFQGYGSGNRTKHGKGENHCYDSRYGSSTHGNQKNSGGTGHGFNNHTNFEVTEAYAYDEFEANEFGNYRTDRMAQNQAKRHGKHSGQGTGFTKPQAYGPGRNMSYEITENETYFSETRCYDESHFYGGARGHRACNGTACSSECNGMECGGKTKNKGNLPLKMMDGISGNSSCSDDNSDNDNDDYGRFG